MTNNKLKGLDIPELKHKKVYTQEYVNKLKKENAELDMKRKAERQIFQGIVEKKNEQLTKAKEIIKGLYFIIQSRIDYENDTGIADEMWRAKQFL